MMPVIEVLGKGKSKISEVLRFQQCSGINIVILFWFANKIDGACPS